MKKLAKSITLLSAVVLSLSLTACSNDNSSTPPKELVPAVSTAVAVDPQASVDATDEKAAASVDGTLTGPVATEVSSEEDYTRVSRDAKNPLHTFSVSALEAGSDNAARYASFKSFTSARAGEFEQVEAEGYSWAYVGQETDVDRATPLAGLVARNADGSVFVCAWSGDYLPNGEEALKSARHRLDSMKKACAIHAS